MKKKIKMLKHAKGCDDGVRSHEYEAGKEYIVSTSLAKCFLHLEVAEIVEEKAKPAHENKALDQGNYQNKSDKKGK